jgi:hypothetical protein
LSITPSLDDGITPGLDVTAQRQYEPAYPDEAEGVSIAHPVI